MILNSLCVYSQKAKSIYGIFEAGKIIAFRAKKIPSSNLSEAGESLNLSFGKLLIGGFGCPPPPTSNGSPPLDFIEFLPKTSTAIYEIAAPLYKKGLSITDIADQTGLKRTSIWSSLRAHKEDLRSQATVPFDRWRKRTGKVNARPPYGFSFFQGEIIKDPKEYPVLQLIHSLWKQGMSIGSIMLKLDERGSKSRMNKPWSYNVIKSIIKRSKNGSTENLVSYKNSKNKKQNSTEVEDEL